MWSAFDSQIQYFKITVIMSSNLKNYTFIKSHINHSLEMKNTYIYFMCIIHISEMGMTTQQCLQFVNRVQSIDETRMQMVYPVIQDTDFNAISLIPVRKARVLLY